jgi:hypothetical protein
VFSPFIYADTRKEFSKCAIDAIYAVNDHLVSFVSIDLVRVGNRLKSVPNVVIEFHHASKLISNCLPSLPTSMEKEQSGEAGGETDDTGLHPGVEFFEDAKLLHGEIGHIVKEAESNCEEGGSKEGSSGAIRYSTKKGCQAYQHNKTPKCVMRIGGAPSADGDRHHVWRKLAICIGH